jgi:hypothetical protein
LHPSISAAPLFGVFGECRYISPRQKSGVRPASHRNVHEQWRGTRCGRRQCDGNNTVTVAAVGTYWMIQIVRRGNRGPLGCDGFEWSTTCGNRTVPLRSRLRALMTKQGMVSIDQNLEMGISWDSIASLLLLQICLVYCVLSRRSLLPFHSVWLVIGEYRTNGAVLV